MQRFFNWYLAQPRGTKDLVGYGLWIIAIVTALPPSLLHIHLFWVNFILYTLALWALGLWTWLLHLWSKKLKEEGY